MQEKDSKKRKGTPGADTNEAAATQEPQDTSKTIPLGTDVKRNNVKDKFKDKGEEQDNSKPPLSKEETIEFYNQNLPFMRLQDEYEEIIYKFNERKIKNLELQVREVEALGYLSQWKATQDDAKRRQEAEQKMKEEWENMSDEEREEYKKKAQANMRVMEMQAAGFVQYDGTNAHDVLSFVTGEPKPPVVLESEDKSFAFQIPNLNGDGFIELKVYPGQKVSRSLDGGYIISE